MITREELYKLAWSMPMTKVAEEFSVSSSYMARVCTQLNVPRPQRGHWAKLAANKAPKPIPLPEPLPGDPLYWSKEHEPLPRTKPSVPRKKQRAKSKKVSVARTHALLNGTKGHFLNTRPVDKETYLKPFKKLLVDITISHTALDKALVFANTLFKSLETAGHRVVIAAKHEDFNRQEIESRENESNKTRHHSEYGLWSPLRPTVVYIDAVAIGLAIVEMSEEVLLRYVDGKYIRESEYAGRQSRYRRNFGWTTTQDLPSGRLCLVAYSPYSRVDWQSDGRKPTRHLLLSKLSRS